MGSLEHFFSRLLVKIPFLTVSPILLMQFPPFVGVVLTGLEALELFVLIDVYPKLQND